ncbi:MAG: hypothetical protein H8D56_19745 [Planctomycetes bacterium]|nr:hypothetical protein [Planctomycetota bacterium]MBL7142802.1 hypothetical protein [Phycisphaerae bacterium]
MQRTHVLLASILLLTIAVCTQAQDPDLLAWWKFDDGTGTIATDSSGNGNDGVFIQDPEWVAGKFGSGLLFDGQGGERVSLGGLDIPSGAMTITCWFKANNLDTPGQDPRMVSKAFGGDNNDHIWMFSSSRIGSDKFLRLRLKTNDGQQTSEIKAGTFEVGEWIHGAIWWDGTDMKIYKNGEEVGSLAKGGTSVALDPEVQGAIGNQPIGAENRPFDGIIDDVRIYTKAMTEAELAEVMAGPPAPLAAGPDPADGVTIEQNWSSLSWQAGTWAVSHDLYFGNDYDSVDQGIEGTFIGNTMNTVQVVGFPGFPAPEGLQPGTTYYWRVDEVNPDNQDSPWKGVVWSFTLPPRGAYKPIPADTMKFVKTNTQLSWTAKWGAALFGVYFGTDPADVENATGAAPSGKFTFDPGTLELNTTYYWRVDAFDGASWSTGDVWSFTTTRPGGGLVGEYANYGGGVPDPPESPFQNVTLIRIDPGIDFQWGNGSPEPDVIDTDNFAVRWTGELEVPLTGRYTFRTTTDDGVLLYINGVEIAKAWRTQSAVEQGSTIDLVAGEFASIKMIYFATSGNAQADLSWEHESFPLEIIPSAALSPPLRAGLIKPVNQAVNVTQTPDLLWTAGDNASEHDVYFGTDAADVANADNGTPDVYQGRQSETGFSPEPLVWNTTYYWRVDEVNATHPDSPWKGSVWSFTTADFLIVDDFESYNAYENQIWWTWKDGLGYVAHDNGPAYNGNGTGSAVGDEMTVSYTEENIRHGGAQSMPFYYDNNKQNTAKYSEAELTLSASRDWTEGGVGELSLWFHGDTANTSERLYVAVSNTAGSGAVVYHDDSNAATIDTWTEWVIPLQTLANQGIDLTHVDRIALGLGNRSNPAAGGSGKMLFDDIRLYRPRN